MFFTVEERNRVRDRLIEMARADSRLAAGALIGSNAEGEGDRWSDLDITFAIAENANLADVVAEWTANLQREFQAVHLFDVAYLSSMYRVFLLPGNLQVDLSFTPRAEFGALGPKFVLLWGTAVERNQPAKPDPQHLFGLAVHHLVRARICVERGRQWQAEYWITEARNQALSLACLHLGLPVSYGRGFDDLPREILRPFNEALVGSLDRNRLLGALGRTVEGLLRNSQDVHDLPKELAGQLHELASVQAV
jgi:predicted nucleotidyltransferase